MKAMILAHGIDIPLSSVWVPPDRVLSFLAKDGEYGAASSEVKALDSGDSSELEVDQVSGRFVTDCRLVKDKEISKILLERVAEWGQPKGFKLYFVGYDDQLPNGIRFCHEPKACKKAGRHTCTGLLGVVPENYVVATNCRINPLRELVGHLWPKFKPAMTKKFTDNRSQEIIKNILKLIRLNRTVEAWAQLTSLDPATLALVVSDSEDVLAFYHKQLAIRTSEAQEDHSYDLLPTQAKYAYEGVFLAEPHGSAPRPELQVPTSIVDCYNGAWSEHFLNWLMVAPEVGRATYDLFLLVFSDAFSQFEEACLLLRGNDADQKLTDKAVAAISAHLEQSSLYFEDFNNYITTTGDLSNFYALLTVVNEIFHPLEKPAEKPDLHTLITPVCEQIARLKTYFLAPGMGFEQYVLPLYQEKISADSKLGVLHIRGPW
ncbi:hypothetical protein [Lentzea sp. NEAU-D7]|uniref:hypothetical protein n=1 Tax=Lentzea sp. NEAU-D7 TaxID=2994667 RepID=UPI00224AB6DD|nr:hypothetical protein [Lentzea sp. NEAU-D7]MCX2954536.1 hypothetical protein [Lentzea sp. NEAU-D7]